MVSLIISIVFAVFLIIGFLVGMSRGLKRTAVRGIWVAVSIILLLFLSTNITMSLLKFPIGNWIPLQVEGVSYVKLPEYITALLDSKLALDGVNYADTVNVILTLISMLINGVVFIVCYWVLKLITLILYWIFNIFIFAGERRKKKALKEEGKKLNKHRLLGGLLGSGLALATFFCTISPLVGYIQVAKSVEARSAENAGTETGILTEYGGDTYTQIVDGYDNSVAGKTFKALGLDKLMTSLLDLNSTVVINKEKVKLSTEAINITDIYYQVKDFNIPNLNTCTQAELSNSLDKIDTMIDVVFKSKTVEVCTDVVVPIGVKFARKEVKTDGYKPYVRVFINSCFDELESYKSEKTKQELLNVVSLVRTLNNNNLLLPIVQGNTGDMVEYLKTNLTKENSNAIVDAVFKLNTANEMAPNIVNFLLGFGAEKADYDYSDETSITATTLKDAALTMLTSAVDVLSCIDKTDGKTNYTINSTLAGALGGMLDAVKGLISPQNFKNVVNGIEPKLNDLIMKNAESLPQFMKDNIMLTINNISEVTSFKDVFQSAYDSYDIIKKQLDGAKENNKYDIDKMNFVEIGKALDKIEANQLIANDVVKNIIIGALDHYSEKYASQISEGFEFTSLAKIKENVNKNMGNGLDISWEIEIPRYKQIVSLAVRLAGEKDVMAKIKDPADTSLNTIGEQLNGPLQDSIIFGGCDRLLVADILQYTHDKITVSTDVDTDKSIKKMLAEAKTNVQDDTRAPFDWVQEFAHIKSVIEVNFDNLEDKNIVVLAGKLDGILFDKVEDGVVVSKASKIISKNMVNEFVVDYLDQVFGEVETTDDFYDTITSIKNGFKNNNILSYKNEFDSLLKLKSCKDDVASGFDIKNTTKVVALGEKIDNSLAIGGTIVNKSLINDYLKKIINKEITLTNQYASIKTNILNRLDDDKLNASVKTYNITSYENEFGYLSKMSKLADDFSEVKMDTIKTAKNSENKTVGECFDDVAGSILVGDAGYIVIKDTLSTYKYDSANADYIAITTVISNNYDNLASSMNYAPNINGIKTHTYVELINNLDEFYQAVSGDNKLTGNFTSLSDLSATQAQNYDNTLASLQENIVVKENGALEVSIFAINKLKDKISGTTPTEVGNYITAYSNYLQLIKSESVTPKQPYNSTDAKYAYSSDGFTLNYSLTDTSGTQMQISRPFEVIYALINA